MKIILTPQQKLQLEQIHDIERDSRVCDRINSVFQLAQVPLSCPHYSYVSRRAKGVDVSFKTKTKGPIQYLAIEAIGLKVYGEGEW